MAAARPKEAIDARITEGLETDYELYKVINKHPGYSVYQLAKETGWSSGKVHGSVRRLEKEGLVRTTRTIKAGRAVLEVRSVPWEDYFTIEELKEFDSLKF